MPRIPLTKGHSTLVDKEDYEDLIQYSWSVTKDGYAQRSSVKGEFKGYRPVRMHRHILKAKTGQIVDHINGNRLDNRRANLRIVSPRQNALNRPSKTQRGATFQHGKWVSQITINYENLYLGRYNTKEEAMRAYDKAAKKHLGKFANQNFKEDE